MSKKYLILSDVHVPFHHHAACSAAWDMGMFIGIDELILNGDFADFYNMSTHSKSASIFTTFDQEIGAVNRVLDALGRGSFKTVYLLGNHEYRLERFINEHPNLYGVLGFESLIKRESRYNFDVIPYTPDQAYRLGNSEVYCRHIPASEGKYPACHTAEKMGVSFITGHVHRFQSYWHRLFDRDIRCFSSGFLGDISTGVFDYVKGHHKWQIGVIIATVDDEGKCQVDLVPWLGDRYIYQGKVFK